MLKCKNSKTNKFYISYLNKFRNLILENKNNLICPVCNEQVFFVDSIIKIKHFRHHPESSCKYSVGETEAHLSGKLKLIKLFGLSPEKNLEVYLGFARPDIYFEVNNKKCAVEFQNSRISAEEIIQRTKRYNEHDVYVLWILSENMFSMEGDDEYRIVKLNHCIKYLHALYFGRIYVLENNERVVPYHFKYINKKTRYILKGKPIINFTSFYIKTNEWYNNLKIFTFKDKIFWDILTWQ